MDISVFGLLSDAADQDPVDAVVANLAMLRDEGFRRVWMGQWPMDLDLLTILAAAMREIDTIEVASGVVPIQNQHPMLLAQRALALSVISGGRFSLGVGLTHAVVSEEWWGIPWDRPIRRLNEYLDGLQPLLAGEEVAAVGETVTARGSIASGPAQPVEVYVAALGPKMLQLAGRRTSGTFTWMTGPETLSTYVGPAIRGAAALAGRPAGSARVVAGLPIVVTDDVDGTLKHAADHLAFYGTLPSYRKMLDREGLTGPEDVAIVGDETAVGAKLDELREAGVDEFVAVLIGESADVRQRTRAALREYGGRG